MRPRWWLVAPGALLVLLALWMTVVGTDAAPNPAPKGGRIVSLSPALTETLFAIGAGDRLVGVSDYCNYPEAANDRPRAGTSITPRYETIVSLEPSVIVTEAVVNARPQELRHLAPTLELRWLTLAEVVLGTRRLGQLAGRVEAANALADRLSTRLSVQPPPRAPRVLLVLGYGDTLDPVWFIRPNSIHGAALRAAGGRNAVAHDVTGQPRLSLERVVELDPDAVIVLLNSEAAPVQRIEEQWRRLTSLTAVKRGRVAALVAPEAFANGPRILDLVDRLSARLKAWSR
ncbi:MAG TPA: helical backbone metal receptor [Polyangiaceae bacterium]|nr:helical backbone metal receptor [Polyangiaceae bacterium]